MAIRKGAPLFFDQNKIIVKKKKMYDVFPYVLKYRTIFPDRPIFKKKQNNRTKHRNVPCLLKKKKNPVSLSGPVCVAGLYLLGT